MDTETIDSTTSESTGTQSTESTGQGQVESQGSQGQTDNAGGSQESSEGGKGQGTDTRKTQFRSKNQTIFELRQSVRERDAKLAELEQKFSQFEQKFQPRGQERKPSRTFWEAPEEVLDERIGQHLSEMEKRMLENFNQTRQLDQQNVAWKQELSEAAKLIRGYKGITDDDITDIRELLVSNPTLQRLEQSPVEQAEYALHLWEKQKGIGDKSGLKNQAASVQGAPPSSGGKRNWTEADIKRENEKFPVDPGKWTPDQAKAFEAFKTEVKQAYHENRVRK